MMTNPEYVTAILNASDALFKSTYEKEKEANFEGMTTQERELSDALGYWSEWGLHPMMDADSMELEEIMEDARQWAAEEKAEEDEERFMEFYRETLLNSPPELFKSVDEKTRENLGDFTEEEDKLAECLSYWAGSLHPLDDDPEFMTWEEIMNRAQNWARECLC